MRKLGEKRVTRIQAAQVALLPQPQTRTEVSPATDLKPGPPLHLGPAAEKRSATSSTSEHTGKKTRLVPQSPPRQETMQWQSIIGSGLTVRDESPWGTFRKYYDCDLAGPVAVCVRSSGDRGVWAVRQYPIEDTDKILRILRSMRHENLASIRECFRTPELLYTLGGFRPSRSGSYRRLRAGAGSHNVSGSFLIPLTYLPDGQMADSVQFVDGLSYLMANSFYHTSLDCSSVLVNLNGHVKIARIDCCVIRQQGAIQASDLAPVSRIMMELMQKYVKEDGAVGIDNLDRWRSCPAAIEFLCATTSQRLLTQITCRPGNLIGLAWFALISARTFYSYTPGPMKND
ncbi:hypothetical protein N7533_010481 [Penicillium manginii]|uniref:uncharacterized protein n=1 Tax=Penicillium manginii TaxID=203109 RepID=UPI002548F3EA|nr:uncharacterized protein N7533_010481 [Penicillium manginii]KAJ5743379.1 hypothetical protein N7533_010481 [Penicillium manginii]